MAHRKNVTILHFNDVYNIEGRTREPVGGAARFAHLVRSYSENQPLILFSGDCFSPSIMSTITRGQQMVSVMNTLGVHVACLGNHELDFGLEHFCSLSSQCEFPWMVSNAIDKETGRPLGDLKTTHLIDWNGMKIGLMALIGEDWLTTLSVLDVEDVIYHDFVSKGKELALELKSKGAEVVIALTHMREPSDVHLLKSVREIDVVMGGHDHHYNVEFIEPNGNLLMKSGTDFRELTKLEIGVDDDGHLSLDFERLEVTSAIPEDPEMKEIVDGFLTSMGASLDQSIVRSSVELDSRFEQIRTEETNLGNFICDILRSASKSEICLLNSGTFRSNRIHPIGEFTKRDLLDVLPRIDETIVLHLSGRDLIKALENGVSQYPEMEGRFLQVSGLSFTFDPNKDRGDRIDLASVYIHDRDEEIYVDEMYTVCTTSYLAAGKDGFDVLKGTKVLMDNEVSPVLPTCIRYHFMTLEVLSHWNKEVNKRPEALAEKYASKMKSVLKRCSSSRSKAKSDPVTFSNVLNCYTITALKEDRIQCSNHSLKNL